MSPNTKDPGNERIRIGQTKPQKGSSQFWKTKKWEHFRLYFIFSPKKYISLSDLRWTTNIDIWQGLFLALFFIDTWELKWALRNSRQTTDAPPPWKLARTKETPGNLRHLGNLRTINERHLGEYCFETTKAKYGDKTCVISRESG